MSVDAEQLPIPQTKDSVGAIRAVRFVAFALFALALVMTVVRAVRRADMQYVGLGAAVSADVATAARTFATEGVWKLRGIPVNNNPPIGTDDRYAHWPPLLPVLLSGCFRVFGTSERTAHIFMLCVLLATAVLVFRLGWLWLGPVGGALAGFFWLTLPVVEQFGDLVAQQSLGMLFVVGALVFFYSASVEPTSQNRDVGHPISVREIVGAMLLFLAVLSSWEAVLVVPGFWLASRRVPELRRCAVLAAVGAGAALVGVTALFTLGSTRLAVDTLQTVKYYMGLSPMYSHVIPNGLGVLSFSQQLRYLLGNHVFMIGLPGLVAVIVLLVRRPANGVLVVYGLAAPWILWTVVMRTHTAFHNFELLIAAPLAALALAWVAAAGLRSRGSTSAALKAVAVVVVATLWTLLPRPIAGGDRNSDDQIRYALDVREATGADAIVVAATLSAVPLYYSERHIIRGIANDGVLAEELQDIRREFPASPLYLAIPPSLARDFAGTLSRAAVIRSTADAIVAKL